MDLAYQFEKWRPSACWCWAARPTARAVFDAMLQRWPDDAYALASRAHLLTEAGQVQAALADSRRLVVLSRRRRGAPGSTTASCSRPPAN